MRLAWPEFEKRVRREHRAELRTSPELNRRFKKARRKRESSPQRIRRVLFTFLIVFGFSALISRVRNPEFGLAIISLWTAGTVFRNARQWFQLFYGSDDLIALNLLPVSDQQIFRVQSRKYASQFAWPLFGSFLLYTAVGLLYFQSSPALLFVAPLAAAVLTALMFSLSLHCAVFLHPLPLGAIAGLLRTAAVFLAVGGFHIPQALPYIIQFSHWFFPTGWANYTLAQLALRHDWATLILLFPLGALIYAGLFSWNRLRAFYSLEGFEIVPSPAAFGGSSEDGPRRGATEIQDTISEGAFLRALNWPGAGWMEKLVDRWFKGRDRTVLEFLVAENPGWTRSLRNSFWLFAIGVAVIYLFGSQSGFIVFFPAYLLASATLPLLGGEWRGLQQFPNGGVFLPGYAIYPITFREITRVLLRVNILRSLVAAPLLLALALLAAWRLGHSPLVGAVVTTKALALFLALQPLLVLFPLSRSTNDTSRMRWIWLLLIPIIVLLLVAGVAVFVVPDTMDALVCVPAALVLSILFHLLYRRAFHHGRFDLLATRPADG